MKDKTGILEALQNIDSGVLSPKGFKAVWDAVKPLVEDLEREGVACALAVDNAAFLASQQGEQCISDTGNCGVGGYCAECPSKHPEPAEGAQGEREPEPRLSDEAESTLIAMIEHCLNARFCLGMDEGFKSFDPEEEHDFVKELREFVAGRAALAQPSPRKSQVAEALRVADWSNTCIGNKALILAAIEQLEAQPSPAPELERPVVVARLYEDCNGDIHASVNTEDGAELMTVAQHCRITQTLNAEIDNFRDQELEWSLMLRELRAERDAAQARVAELEQCLYQMQEAAKSLSAPVAQAGQVPEEVRHWSDCATNNRGCPELLGPCDCGGYKEGDA